MTLTLRNKDHLKTALLGYLSRYREQLIGAALFLVVASLFTFPFVLRPFSTLTAPPAGDVSNSVTKYDAIKREHKNPFFDDRLYSIAAPEGVESNVAVDRVSILSTAVLWLTTLATTALFANGIVTFLGYFLTGFITFLIVRKITGSLYIACLSGIIYCCFPLFIGVARAAPVYSHMWLYLLPIWAFWNICRSGFSTKSTALAALSIAPAFFWTPYYTFHIVLVGGACLVATILFLALRKRLNIRSSWPILGIGLTWGLFCLTYLLLGMSTEKGGAPQRTLSEAYEQSAQPLMYLLPGAITWWGHGAYQLLVNWVPRAEGTNLYLGISVVLLALTGAVQTIRTLARKTKFNEKQWAVVAIGLIALSVAFFTFIFSLAPTIHLFGLEIPTPNKLVVEFVPALRAGQRLAMPLMGSVVILASIGILFLAKRVPIQRRTVAFVLLAAVVCFDISSYALPLTSHIKKSDAIAVLQHSPKGLVAQYVNSSVGDPGQIACQTQFQHQLPIINDCGIKKGTDTHYVNPLLKSIGSAPSLCDQKSIMRQANVKYVILAQTEWDKVVDCYTEHGKIAPIAADNRFMVFQLY